MFGYFSISIGYFGVGMRSDYEHFNLLLRRNAQACEFIKKCWVIFGGLGHI